MSEVYTGFSETYNIPEDAGSWLIKEIYSYEQTICKCRWTKEGLLHLWCDKHMDVEMLAFLCQKMMVEFDIDDSMNIEWSMWSTNPMEVGKFGGGFVIVTRKNIYWGDTTSMIEEYYE